MCHDEWSAPGATRSSPPCVPLFSLPPEYYLVIVWIICRAITRSGTGAPDIGRATPRAHSRGAHSRYRLFFFSYPAEVSYYTSALGAIRPRHDYKRFFEPRGAMKYKRGKKEATPRRVDRDSRIGRDEEMIFFRRRGDDFFPRSLAFNESPTTIVNECSLIFYY